MICVSGFTGNPNKPARISKRSIRPYDPTDKDAAGTRPNPQVPRANRYVLTEKGQKFSCSLMTASALDIKALTEMTA